MKHKRLNIVKLFALTIIALGISLPTMAADAYTESKHSWERGIKAYRDKDYAAAVENFEHIVDLGYASADVYYNLGNAYFRLGQNNLTAENTPFADGELGNAILNYRRALKINPAMEDAQYNLDLAVDYTNDKKGIPVNFFVEIWRSVRDIMSSNHWTIISLTLLGLTAIFTLVYLLAHRTTLRKVAFGVALLCVAGFALSTIMAISQSRVQQTHDRAVVICAAKCAVHPSPDNASKIIREPSQGVTVRVVSTENEWSEIEFSDGEKGWILSKYIELI